MKTGGKKVIEIITPHELNRNFKVVYTTGSYQCRKKGGSWGPSFNSTKLVKELLQEGYEVVELIGIPVKLT